MKKTISIVLVLALGLATMSLAAEDTWTYKTNMPTARVFTGGCVIDGRIYVISGATSSSSVTPAVEMYDPIADIWTRKANIPSARCYPATCTFDGKIYVFGGTSPDMWSTAKKNVYVYDPQTDSWTQKADMPYENAACGIAVVDGIIYLIGGSLSESSRPIPTVMAYDPVTESWTQKADMPTARGFFSACVVDGKIFAIGGSKEDWRVYSYKCVEVYDPSTNTWVRKSDMPTQRWCLGACVVDGKIFAVGGGIVETASTTANEVYNPATDTWITESPMQQERYGLVVASVGNKIYAIGGTVPPMLSTVEEYDTGLGIPSPDFNGDEIVDIEDLLILIEHWGQNEPSVDIAPPPFGDGIIDVQDLEVLMSYWGQEIPSPAAVARWKFDEESGSVAADSVGGHHGALVGDPVWRPADGQIGGALELDGIDDCIGTPLVVDPGAGPFSVFAWVKGGMPGQVILSQEQGANWLLADASDGALATDLKGGRAAKPLKSSVNITDGQWHHVGFTWDGSNRTLYVDEVQVSHDTQVGLWPATGGLYIGAGNALQAATFWSGLIDDVRIYNRAVTPSGLPADFANMVTDG
jgi:N-acetylneuraminic acid mutarotase